ncbi:hypothetical protein ABZW32_19130 [Streptomyces sp. NPDC004667]|uniref:hypothetical protein n=1 Tax=Streptomyces sp. NPDC004667 TaxID=3154285 RepID=UPI0033B39E46
MLTEFEEKIFNLIEGHLYYLPAQEFSDAVPVFLDSLLEFLGQSEFIQLQEGPLGEHSDEFQAIRGFGDRAYVLRESFGSLAYLRSEAFKEVAAYREAAEREADEATTPHERGRLRMGRVTIGKRLTEHLDGILAIAGEFARTEEEMVRAVLALERYFQDVNAELNPPLPEGLAPWRDAFALSVMSPWVLAQYTEGFLETAQRLRGKASVLAKSSSKHPKAFRREAGFRSGHEEGIPVHEDYRDESAQHPSARAKSQPPGAVTTHYALDVEELRASEVIFPQDGSLPHLGNGGPMPETGGWVMLTGGSFHVFDPHQLHVYENGVRTRTLDSLDDYESVISQGHTIRLMHHSSLAAGKEITAGGMFTLKAKRLETATWYGSTDPESYGELTLDNWSGHYRPTAADMGRAARKLGARGGGKNTSVVLKGLSLADGGRKSDGLEEISRMKARVDEEDYKIHSPVDRKAKYPYNDGDSTVPFSVMEALGENADIHSIKFHERVQAELKDTATTRRVPDEEATSSGRTGRGGEQSPYDNPPPTPPADSPYAT